MPVVTPCPANPNRPSTSPSHRVLRSVRRNEEVRSSTTPARQLRESNIQNHHIQLIEIKYCADTRPGAQLEASQQQHSKLCKQLQGAEITLHTILLGIDPRRSTKLARKLHAHSVQYAQKLTSTRRAIEIKKFQHNSGALGLHASRNPPHPHQLSSCPLGVFSLPPSGNKHFGTHDRMGMEFASKFNSMLVVKSQLFTLVKVVLSITIPINTQKDGG
eukprot:1160712-Pelagomonas_calceolata.AAC.2